MFVLIGHGNIQLYEYLFKGIRTITVVFISETYLDSIPQIYEYL